MSSSGHPRALLPVTLAAVGVVYGDIGTSPLYAMRECFFGSHSVPPTHDNVLGVLSLIVYSLLLVISVKYIVIVMRADNQGEGGILALTALIPGAGKRRGILILLGIFGAALLYGDGMITPAVTVLGAVEGLKVASPVLDRYVVPAAVTVLVVIFAIQRHGTHRVGRLFGPIMVGWFAVLALLGIIWIARYPDVLTAIDPRHAVRFLIENRGLGFAVLGAVFLVVTGGEALYADMGHFGARPIRVAWFAIVLPALLLNYFGQGALLLHVPETRDPFFQLAPAWTLPPLVILATAAAIIASQALISGAFSLTRQAIQLGYAPRLTVEHTASWQMGQIYVPQVNWVLAIGTILIVIGFGSSGALAAAYGIAVALTMIITAILLHVIAVERWRWPLPAALAVTATFLAIDVTFFSANLLKFVQGGWLPIAIGISLFTLMTTWKTGRRILYERLSARAFPLEAFVTAVRTAPPTRVSGTAIFMTAQPTGTPAALVHNLHYNKMLHEHVVVLTVATVPTPHVDPDERLTVRSMGASIYNARIQYGFMEDPDIPAVLGQLRDAGVPIDEDDLTFFLGRETIVVGRRPGMATWREKLFVLMSRNSVRATAFFNLPPERVVELGVQVEM
ncbi:MAG TPA: potassium transporter Kup [Vicinamibacterales bacterium]|nr:potassium transporter Kup [Vicinamibacterales bacterium]